MNILIFSYLTEYFISIVKFLNSYEYYYGQYMSNQKNLNSFNGLPTQLPETNFNMDIYTHVCV